MGADNSVWMVILGYMTLAISISVLTSLWIRHHLKSNNNHGNDRLDKHLDKHRVQPQNVQP